MIWPQALRLAGEVARLRRENRELRYRAVRAELETVKVRATLQRMARDIDLVACMARDPKTAAEFVRDAHRIAGLPQTEETA